MKLSLLLLIIVFFCMQSFGQENKYSSYGNLYRFKLKNAPFPSAARDSGHVYSNTHYPKEKHYNDSTVLVFVPEYLSIGNEVDIVVYFHGWNNNVDTVLAQFKLIEQFHAGGKQAILVMPEGPKNAPDSFGGKLEESGRFRLLIDQVLQSLQMTGTDTEQINNPDTTEFTPGNIILAGHSGAYRVIAYILMRGGLTENIKEVFLFDGLYADVEKYSYWLDHHNGRFINIYTPSGGTKRESENMMECLSAWNMPYALIESDDFNDEELSYERIIFIRSSLGHNEVISSQDQFKKFLETGSLK
jgi:hypothetical protein